MRRRARKAWDKLGLFGQIGVVALVVVLALFIVLKWVPELLANHDLTGKNRAEDEGRNRTALLATLAGVLAAIGAYYTHRTFQLNRQRHDLDRAGQITERFTRAIDQLGAADEHGNSKIDVVMGGIYALERIAKDSDVHHQQVVEVLTAYVREHTRCKPGEPQAPKAPGERGQGDKVTSPDDRLAPRLAADIQAAVDVLARRDITQDRPNYRLNLADAVLRRLVLDAGEGGHLERANLQDAHLVGAWLQEAHLEGASLQEAHLQEAYLVGAHLEGANLAVAHLEKANLQEAHLEGAYLGGAHFEGTVVTGAYYDNRTHWPTPEFEAKALAAGARHVNERDDDRAAETD